MTNQLKDKAIESSDHFQLLIDYKIKKERGTANTSQLLIELDASITTKELTDYLQSNSYFDSLVNVSLFNPLFGKMRYRFNQGKKVVVNEVVKDSIVYADIFQNDDIGVVPVKITLIQLKNSSSILFQFNHIFIDHNGAMNLLSSFNGAKFDFIKSLKEEETSLFSRLKSTVSLSVKMLNKWYQKKAFIDSNSDSVIQKEYTRYVCSQEETNHIKSKIRRSHHIKSISSLLMGACCIGVKQLLLQRDETLKEFIFQQPFDSTPKKTPPYILGNRFSFIHYRLQPGAVNNLADIENELNRQTLEQIKERTPQRFIDLESILRNFPLRLHMWMISLPAKGKMTTFAYTFIDESKVIEEFAGRKITNIVNIPPVMRRPPVTFGFSYYESKLVIQQGFDKNAITEEEAQFLFDTIKKELLA